MTNEEAVRAIVGRVGRAASVQQLVAANMRLWHSWVDTESSSTIWGPGPYTVRSEAVLTDLLFPAGDAFADLFVGLIRDAALIDDRLSVQRRIFDPDVFVSAIIPSTLMRPEDRRYFVRASIRRMGLLHWNEELRRVFGILSAATSSPSSRAVSYGDLRRLLLDALSPNTPSDQSVSYVDAYLAALREFRMMVPETPRGRVRISPDDIDSEYLVSGLFGVSSGIAGLDQLFGGSGPILPDSVSYSDDRGGSRHADRGTCLNARTILVRGPAGSGKSLLACHLAASVAGKGGIATIVSAEQGPEEYLYTLRTMGLSPATAGFQLVFTEEGRARLRSESAPAVGAIVYAGVDRDLPEEGFPSMTVLAKRMSAYPLRLLIVDSLNGITNMARARDIDIRGTLAAAFRTITTEGVNLLIIEEEQGPADLRFEEQQNLADTVLRLHSKSELTYQKRFVQILKLRFQREQRGEHPFSIVSGSGIQVIPSPVAVRTRVSRRRARGAGAGPDPIGLGIGDLDAIAGTPLRPGHIVLLEGVAGTRKSVIASAFLAANQGKANAGSSVLLAIGEPAVGAWPATIDGAGDPPSPPPNAIGIKSIPRGFASPGTVFQRLDEIFDAGVSLGKPTHRLAIDDLASLDVDAPLVAGDPSFGHILCDYLRRQDAISLLVSRTAADGERDLVRRAVAANADFHFLLTHRRGERHGHVLLTVLKSPGMRHRTGWFDLSVEDTKVDIAGTPSLVDLDRNGDERRLRVVLFMFADAEPHNVYNSRVAAALQSNPNLDVDLKPQTPVVGSGAFNLGGRSGYRDIRIVQLDEFQVPKPTEPSAGLELFHFDANDVPSAAQSLPQVGDRTKVTAGEGERGAQRFLATRPGMRRAVPYYCNLGFLVLRDRTTAVVKKLLDGVEPDRLGFSSGEETYWRKFAEHVRGEKDPGKIVRWLDWQALALLSEVFESRRTSGRLDEISELPGSVEDFVFFDHTGWTEENYNVLFLEILLWVRSGQKLSREKPSLESWLLHPTALTAIKIFWRLLRPAYEREERARTAGGDDDRTDDHPAENDRLGAGDDGAESAHAITNVRDRALVWRQWFTTLAELCAHLNRDEARRLLIQPLPRDCGVAGDWYLGVLADSALPMGALHIIRRLTTAEAELERLRGGIGLPTQLSYYTSGEARHRPKPQDRRDDSGEPASGVSPSQVATEDTSGEPDDEAKVDRASFTSISSQLTLPMSKRKLRKLVEGAFRRSELSGYARKASTLFAALRRVLEFQSGGVDAKRTSPVEQPDSFLQPLVVELVEQLVFIERSSRSAAIP